MHHLSAECGIRRRIISHSEVSGYSPWELTPPKTDTTLAGRTKSDEIPRELQYLALEHITKYADCVQFFTDGSKAELGVGIVLL